MHCIEHEHDSVEEIAAFSQKPFLKVTVSNTVHSNIQKYMLKPTIQRKKNLYK